MTSTTVQNMMTTYKLARKNNAKQMELAVQERELWAKLVKDKEGNTARRERRDWFADIFGGRVSEYDHRSVILKLGPPCCDELFKLVDTKAIPLAKAAKIGSLTRYLARANNTTAQRAFEHILRESEGGTGSLKELESSPAKATIEPEAFGEINFKKFRNVVKKLGQRLLDESLHGLNVDELVRNRIGGEFEVGLEVTVDGLISSINSAKGEAKSQALTTVGRVAFANACAALGLHDEVYGKPIDIRRVLRSYKRRSFERHPDRNNGDARSAAEYRAVQEARRTLEYYSQQVGVTKKGKK